MVLRPLENGKILIFFETNLRYRLIRLFPKTVEQLNLIGKWENNEDVRKYSGRIQIVKS